MSDEQCRIPPLGWICTRRAGHGGPCAAVECQEEVSQSDEQDDRESATVFDWNLADERGPLARAIDRMCMPLDPSRLSGVTAEEDARCMRTIRDGVGRLQAEVQRLTAENDALRTEAELYRWLRDRSHPDAGVYYLASSTMQARFADPTHVDREIAAAMQSDGTQPGGKR